MDYEVYMLDKLHYGDSSENYTWGTYATYEEALAVARHVVDRCPMEQYVPGMAGDALFSRFMMFGDTPVIVGPDCEGRFSGSVYARKRAREICAVANAAGRTEGAVS